MPLGTGVAQRCRHAVPGSAGCSDRSPGVGPRLRQVHEGEVSAGGHLSQVEAAQLVGCSRDTIVRARRSGRFPGARLEGDRWIIPAADLVTAGLYQPSAETDDPSPASPPANPVEPTEPAAVELARTRARIAGLEEVVARQDDELRFLRLTVETLATRGAA